MPRFFDDYSNTYLTHDSAAGRKQQRRGWKFRENFRLHYEKHLQEWRSGPNGLASAQQAFLKSVPSADLAPPLPEGWVEEIDMVTRTPYYVNEDGRRSWVRPGFRPPPVAPPMSGGFPFNKNVPPPNFPPPSLSNQNVPPPTMFPPPFPPNLPVGPPPPS